MQSKAPTVGVGLLAATPHVGPVASKPEDRRHADEDSCKREKEKKITLLFLVFLKDVLQGK